jgi:hypothetical protein
VRHEQRGIKAQKESYNTPQKRELIKISPSDCNQDSKQNTTYTVNIYRYKAIGANATASVISTTWKCISPCLEIL